MSKLLGNGIKQEARQMPGFKFFFII